VKLNPAPLMDGLTVKLDAFIASLEAEQRLLAKPDAENLAPVVEEKSRLANEVALLWRQLAQLGEQDPAFQPEIEQGRSSEPARARAWQRIRDLAKKADLINRTNRELIDAQMLRTRQALDILQQAAQRNSTYGADGLMRDFPGRNSRSLDSA